MIDVEEFTPENELEQKYKNLGYIYKLDAIIDYTYEPGGTRSSKGNSVISYFKHKPNVSVNNQGQLMITGFQKYMYADSMIIPSIPCMISLCHGDNFNHHFSWSNLFFK